MMITITLNGQPKAVEPGLSADDLLAREGYADMTIALAHNGTFVPKARRDTLLLREGDALEIVAPMQGG